MRGRFPGWVSVALVMVALLAELARADAPKAGRTIVVPIEGEIDLGLAPFVERLIAGAGEGDTILLQINTFGGRIDAGVRIRDALLHARVPTVAFIDKRAISAGALIALACDTIVMANGATIGAATPVELEGGKMKPVEDKVVSYMRKEMKATAEAKGRRADIAEAMVDATAKVDGLDDADHTLTLTTDEAVKYKIAAFRADTVEEVCARLSRPEPDRLRPALNWAERLARFLSDPAIASLLMTLGMLGILVELWHPGHAVSGVIGVLCLAAFFFGQYVVHLAGWGEILLFVFGLAALTYEVFLWHGHGWLAVLGVLTMVAALVLALVDASAMPLDVAWSLGWIGRSLARVFGSLMATAVLMIVATRFLPKTRFGRPLVLNTAITAHAGAAAAQLADSEVWDPAALIGARGAAETPLRPSGKVIIDGRRYDVVTGGEFLEAGTPIEVAAADGSRIVVQKKG
jgi:membrane-bound serine protease (ClpP class)